MMSAQVRAANSHWCPSLSHPLPRTSNKYVELIFVIRLIKSLKRLSDAEQLLHALLLLDHSNTSSACSLYTYTYFNNDLVCVCLFCNVYIFL